MLGRCLAGRLASLGAVDSVDDTVAVVSVAGLDGPPQERRLRQSSVNRILRIMIGEIFLVLNVDEILDANLSHIKVIKGKLDLKNYKS